MRAVLVEEASVLERELYLSLVVLIPLAILAEAVQGLARRGIWVRRALALLVLVAGLGSLGMRMARGGHMQHHVGPPAPTSTDGIQAPAHGGGAMPDMPGR